MTSLTHWANAMIQHSNGLDRSWTNVYFGFSFVFSVLLLIVCLDDKVYSPRSLLALMFQWRTFKGMKICHHLLTFLLLNTMKVNGCRQLSDYTHSLTYSFVFNRREKLIQVWNNLRVRKSILVYHCLMIRFICYTLICKASLSLWFLMEKGALD